MKLEKLSREVTKDFGRVAASTAKQVVMQKLEKLKEKVWFEENKMNLLLEWLQERMLNYYIDLGRTHGILPKKEIIPGETIVGNSLRFIF